MLKKVKLYGELAEKYGKEWDLAIDSPAEAIRALMANNPSFRQFVSTSEERGVGYKVIVGREELADVAGEISNPTGRQDIKIVPVIGGAKRGVGQIILGALMIYAAVMTAGMSVQATALAAAGGAGTAAGGTIAGLSMTQVAGIGMANLGGMSLMAAKFGGALLLGGIASMLAPTPPTLTDAAKAENYAFNGAANTTQQGVAIPVCYGQLMVGGAVISSGVSPEDYTP
jgi:predicted phage tail protein